MPRVDVVIIGGTGLYRLAQLTDVVQQQVETPFGSGSAPFDLGLWCGRQVAFLARHGIDHQLAPHQVNYRANMLACRQLRPSAVVAVNAVGSIDAAMPPGQLVLPDQIIDYTWGREHSFWGRLTEELLHVDFSEPYSRALRDGLRGAATEQAGFAATRATYGAMQGPRLESAAEVERLRRDGCDLVGMTGMPEAALARELELNYASICLVANWAAGFGPQAGRPLELESIKRNFERARGRLTRVLERWLTQLEPSAG